MNTHVPVGPLAVPTLPACSPSAERGRGRRPGRKGLPTMTPPGLAGSPRGAGHRGKRPQGAEDTASWPPFLTDGVWTSVMVPGLQRRLSRRQGKMRPDGHLYVYMHVYKSSRVNSHEGDVLYLSAKETRQCRGEEWVRGGVAGRGGGEFAAVSV